MRQLQKQLQEGETPRAKAGADPKPSHAAGAKKNVKPPVAPTDGPTEKDVHDVLQSDGFQAWAEKEEEKLRSDRHRGR